MTAERAGGVLSEEFRAHLTGFGAGSLVAGYRLEAQVGAGGMATVFRARDERLGRLVALKILASALASDLEFRRRFIAESRAAAAVDDPHIIPVYEAGEADGVLFIAMRFVIGGDLRRVLAQEGALPPDRAAAFISPVASALDAAHAAGLVHRDVKPANILVDARRGRPDHVYLSDFGVSKGAVSSVSLTGTGQFLGTPTYSAPEQIQGWAVDGRRSVRTGMRGLRAADRGGTVRARPGHGSAIRAHVRAAAVAGIAAARIAQGRRSGAGSGDGQGPGAAVRVLPGIRRRAAGGARPGAIHLTRFCFRASSPATRDSLAALVRG
jgi:hypothetical protein